jgi:FAD/FMN-containing dehydrogenase
MGVADLESLSQSIRGRVITPGDPRYDACRVIFNGTIDRRPRAVVRPRSMDDVATVLRFTQDAGLELSIRGGGHNIAGHAICNGVVADFTDMRTVEIDAVRRRAIVQPGATWGEFDEAAQRSGLATTGGIISDTGVAGLTLGGGLGWLMGKYGLSCDNLLRARVMLATGEIVTADEDENTDLFWALRGGGGNFGIVLEFEFALHPVHGVFAGSVVYPLSMATEAFHRFISLGDIAPDELTLDLVMTTGPTGEKTVTVDACYLGSESRGQVATSSLRFAEAVADTRRFQSYCDWQQTLDDHYRRGRRSYWKSLYITRLDGDFLDLIVEAITTAPSPYTMLTFDHVHGRASRIPASATAFSHRDKRYLFLINTNWNDPDDDELNVSWTRELFDRLVPFGPESAYVNYLSDEGQTRVRAAYGHETYERLAKVKAKYDPRNVFRHNQNVLPADSLL